MPALIDPAAFDRASGQAERIVDFYGDDELQQRIEELAGKANEGSLTEAERAEYQGYVQGNNFIAVLQAKATYSFHGGAIVTRNP